MPGLKEKHLSTYWHWGKFQSISYTVRQRDWVQLRTLKWPPKSNCKEHKHDTEMPVRDRTLCHKIVRLVLRARRASKVQRMYKNRETVKEQKKLTGLVTGVASSASIAMSSIVHYIQEITLQKQPKYSSQYSRPELSRLPKSNKNNKKVFLT